MEALSRVWRWFRGTPRWLQAGSVAVVVLWLGLALRAGDDNEAAHAVGDRDSTTTTVDRTTTAEHRRPTTTTSAARAADETAVLRITDGDTIVVTDGTRVRLIGIDTPETKDPRTPVECFGAEATAHLTELIPPGTAVRLVYDAERFDGFGRTLAYVYRASDSLFVNLAMVEDGFAAQLTIPPNIGHVEEFTDAAARAREAAKGLWGACGGPDTPVTTAPSTTSTAVPPPPPPPSTTLALVAPPAPSGNCDPSYPTVCIPPSPPDLDCPDIPDRRFEVRPPDPHRFDADHDGIGCESG